MQAQIDHPEAFKLCQCLDLTERQMHEVISLLSKEIILGLGKYTHWKATVKCFVTYVQDLASGKETGKYLGLDVNENRFHILLVNLTATNDNITKSETYSIPSELLLGSGKEFFDFIATNLQEFVQRMEVENEELEMGFTFAFPLRQEALNKGYLINWTKGVECEGVEGNNVLELLQEAINRCDNLKIKVIAVASESVGILMTCGYKHKDCRIGLIIDEFTSACYVEQTTNAEQFADYKVSTKPNMIINSEWGGFGDNGVLDFISTKYDKEIDKRSGSKGRYIFEKLIAGYYLGEQVRLIILDLFERKKIFENQESHNLYEPYIFKSIYIKDIDSDPPGKFTQCNLVLEKLGITDASDKDKSCLRFIGNSVMRRSAKLCACGLVCFINRMKINNLSIGISGHVYCSNRLYKNFLVEYVTELLSPTIRCKMFATDDVCFGIALIAASVAEANKVVRVCTGEKNSCAAKGCDCKPKNCP